MKTKSTKEGQTKNIFKIILKYVRELSVVVAGIAITFMISNMVSNKNERRDVQRYLDTVKMELQDNLSIVEENINFYNKSAAFNQYLMTVDQADIAKDSLIKYDETIRNFLTIHFKTSAFEMLKISGAMSLIKDKVLLQSIIDSYTAFSEAASASDIYMNRKLDEVFKTMLDAEVPSFLDLKDPKNVRLYKFFTVHMNVEDSFKNASRRVNETLKLF